MFTRSTSNILKSLEKNVTALQRREADMGRKVSEKSKRIEQLQDQQAEEANEAGRARRAANKIANLIN